MYRTVFWIVCLLLVSTGVMAAPRALIRDGSQIGFANEKMGVPVSAESRHVKATDLQRSATETLTEFYSPSTGNDETDVIGSGRFEATGKLRNRNRDILISFAAQDHSDCKTISTGGLVIKHIGPGIDANRNEANAATEAMPAQIKLVLAQPAAPPVTHEQTLTPRQA